MAKKSKKQTKEYVPEGMSRKDFADAEYRKKTTMAFGCILLVFIIGIVAFISVGFL